MTGVGQLVGDLVGDLELHFHRWSLARTTEINLENERTFSNRSEECL
jgi:hypothetical protein